jgi:predicted nucleotidyltransferase
MIKRSLDLLDKIEPSRAEILDLISSIAKEMNIPFFIVGATARDIFFELIHSIKIRRATLDLDLGIHIGAWDSYYSLMKRLIETGQFAKSDLQHRIYYIKNRYPVDIVPFGGISGEKGVII